MAAGLALVLGALGLLWIVTAVGARRTVQTPAQPLRLVFTGFESEPLGRVAAFYFTNTQRATVLLFNFEKAVKAGTNWTPVDGVYGDIWFEDRGRTNLGNPRIKPGERLKILALPPPGETPWRFGVVAARRKPFAEEWGLKLRRAWEDGKLSNLWYGMAWERGQLLQSEELDR